MRKLHNWSLPITTEFLKASCASNFGVTTRRRTNNHPVIRVSFVQTWHSASVNETSISSKGYIHIYHVEKARKCHLPYAWHD